MLKILEMMFRYHHPQPFSSKNPDSRVNPGKMIVGMGGSDGN
ncbi:hypothetical protein [Acetobacterium sp. MES1]|nr:hypothetical protein [Acetobacterium sp. MES1]